MFFHLIQGKIFYFISKNTAVFISSGKRKRNMLGMKIQNSSINYPVIIYSLMRSAHGPIHCGPNKKNGAQISHAQQNIGESLSTAVYLLELALFQVRRNTFVGLTHFSLISNLFWIPHKLGAPFVLLPERA